MSAAERARKNKANGFWNVEGFLSSLSANFSSIIGTINAFASMSNLLEPNVVIDANVTIPTNQRNGILKCFVSEYH